ncbi:MAG: ThuA domain-containing protein [Ferruginibacter sp.]
MIHHRHYALIFSAFLFLFSYSYSKQPTEAVKSEKKKIVLIPGKDSHGIGVHEYLGGCQLLAKMLNENMPGVEAVVTEQGWPKDTTLLDSASAIVMYSDGGEGHIVIPHMAHIDKLIKQGVGLVNVHYSLEIPKGKGGGDNFLRWIGGYFESYRSINPFWTPKFDSLPVHPITRGVKPFEARDEWYYFMRFVENDSNLVSILKKLPPDSSLSRPDGPHSGNPEVRKAVLERKEPQTIAWAYTRPDGGRGFGFTGGHQHSNWKNDDFRKVVLNGIVWAAKIEVPENGVPSTTPTDGELLELQKKK